MDPLTRITAGENALERIANAIPGFAGYRDRERRRDADRVAREYLATRLDGSRKELDALAEKASRVGALDAINDIEAARKKTEALAARLRYAASGYSGFFDAVKIDEAVLGRVYQFDLALATGVEEARAAAEAAGAAAGGIGPALQLLITKLAALDAALGERAEILSGLR